MAARAPPASSRDPPDPSPASEVYANHWRGVYENSVSARTREWHCEYGDCRAFIAPYCARAASEDGTVLDVGCGGSSFGDELRKDFGLGHLLLTDIDPGIARVLRARYNRAESQDKSLRSVRVLVSDCTSMTDISSESCAIVLDKGTLDALHGEEDKLKMIAECVRVLDPRRGVFVSVSFASAGRVGLLRKAARDLRARFRVKVIGAGDPRRGHSCVFACVLGRRIDEVPQFFEPDDALTRTVLRRVEDAGSGIEDEPPSVGDALTLFDEDDEDDEDDENDEEDEDA
jgi:SAM-dependent methyltransferase